MRNYTRRSMASAESLVLDPEPIKPPNFNGRRKDLSIVPHSRPAALSALAQLGPVVYAVRVGELVKIGHTTNLSTRIQHLSAEHSTADLEILAFKFGTRDDERATHQQLKPSLARGREWYHPTPQVLRLVNLWRAALGRDSLTH